MSWRPRFFSHPRDIKYLSIASVKLPQVTSSTPNPPNPWDPTSVVGPWGWCYPSWKRWSNWHINFWQCTHTRKCNVEDFWGIGRTTIFWNKQLDRDIIEQIKIGFSRFHLKTLFGVFQQTSSTRFLGTGNNKVTLCCSGLVKSAIEPSLFETSTCMAAAWSASGTVN